MSTLTTVFPINVLSFTVDRSITNAKDVINHLALFEPTVKQYPFKQSDGNDYTVYGVSDPSNNNADVVLFKYAIGPIEISIAYDPQNHYIDLQVFLVLPIIGTVLVGSVTGSVEDGVSVTVSFGSLLSGTFGVKIIKGKITLWWKFTAFGLPYEGQLPIPI